MWYGLACRCMLVGCVCEVCMYVVRVSVSTVLCLQLLVLSLLSVSVARTVCGDLWLCGGRKHFGFFALWTRGPPDRRTHRLGVAIGERQRCAVRALAALALCLGTWACLPAYTLPAGMHARSMRTHAEHDAQARASSTTSHPTLPTTPWCSKACHVA